MAPKPINRAALRTAPSRGPDAGCEFRAGAPSDVALGPVLCQRDGSLLCADREESLPLVRRQPARSGRNFLGLPRKVPDSSRSSPILPAAVRGGSSWRRFVRPRVEAPGRRLSLRRADPATSSIARANAHHVDSHRIALGCRQAASDVRRGARQNLRSRRIFGPCGPTRGLVCFRRLPRATAS